MKPNAFEGKLKQPTAEELAAVLGPAQQRWNHLLSLLASEFAVTGSEWTSYSPKAGWTLRPKKGKRNVLYLSPHAGSFTVSLILGDKAVQALREGKPSGRIAKLLDEAKHYPEGNAVSVELRSDRDLAAVRSLIAAKLGT